jgi:hypothetical protein
MEYKACNDSACNKKDCSRYSTKIIAKMPFIKHVETKDGKHVCSYYLNKKYIKLKQ